MVWERLRGHTGKPEMFRRAIGRGRLSHTWLFVGPAGVGRKTFARLLAQCLFCSEVPDEDLEACGHCHNCRQLEAGSHPDLLEVRRAKDSTRVRMEQIAGDDGHRGREGLCYDLSLRPMSANRRIAIIDDAETLILGQMDAANALLKTLEEPPDRCLLFLLTTSIEAMLPTIRSRCQTVRFEPLAEADVAALLLEHQLVDNPEDAAATAAVCDGSLQTARELLDSEIGSLRQELYQLLSARPVNSRQLAEALIDMVGRAGSDAPAQRQQASWILRFASDFFRQVLRCLADPSMATSEALARYCASLPAGLATYDVFVASLDRLAATTDHLKTFSPVALCMEALAEDLGALLRPLSPSRSAR